MVIEAFERVHLDGTGIDRITEDEVVAVVRDALSRGRGGRIITPNVDILRRASADPAARRHLDDADLIVADGMPLIWASRLGGAPLPERVAGSSLIWSLSQGLGRDARSVFVIGGAPAPRVIAPETPTPQTSPAASPAEPTSVAPTRAEPAASAASAPASTRAEPAASVISAAAPISASPAAPATPAASAAVRAARADAPASRRATLDAPAPRVITFGSRKPRAFLADSAGLRATPADIGTLRAAGSDAARSAGPDAAHPVGSGDARSAGGLPVAGQDGDVPIAGARRNSATGTVTVREVRASGAVRAAARLAGASPGLRIAGAISPPFGFEEDEATYAEVCAQVIAAEPDLVFVGLGFPKQESVIERLRRDLPSTWFVGCGAAVNFVAGDVHRAPRWMQRTGLEWAHRLGTEPRRLARRYLRHDAPYALRLLARAPRRRSRPV